MKSPAGHARSIAFGLKIDLFNNARFRPLRESGPIFIRMIDMTEITSRTLLRRSAETQWEERKYEFRRQRGERPLSSSGCSTQHR
jgi:hypothetical protein